MRSPHAPLSSNLSRVAGSLNPTVPIDFIVLDIDCNPTCPIIFGRPFLRTIGAIIDMKEGHIRFQFPLRKGMENFPRNKIKLPYESIMRATYGLHTKDDNT